MTSRNQSRSFDRNENLGFTLIDLVVVIVILGIVAAVAFPRLVDAKSDARLAKMRSYTGVPQTAVETVTAKWHASNEPASLTMPDAPRSIRQRLPPASLSFLMQPGSNASP